MTHAQDINLTKDRLAQAQADCEAWRASGMKEKYLEAYVLVEALQLQLDRQVKEQGAGQQTH